MLAVVCCVDSDVYVAAGFNCSLLLQVADSYPLSVSRARMNEGVGAARSSADWLADRSP
jgi:hypothetical protein